MRAFIFGAGFSGRAWGKLLAERQVPVAGTTRTEDNFAALRAAGITPFLFDGGTLSDEVLDTLHETTHLVASIAPGAAGDPALKALRSSVAALPRLEWIGYLSTVGVYGDHGGDWVDEDTACRPASQRSVRRLAAEASWRFFADTVSAPLAILRLAGIYGPGRNAFVNLEAGTARRLVKPGQVFNRIHVEDIARALDFLAEGRMAGIYNVADDEPAPPQDVVEHAASLMKIDPPPETDFETATLSPMARSFYGENKRVSNAKIKGAGFTLVHPDYRQALERMWKDGSWR
ncbi:MAG: SDR family oxidoreductase [Oricola sp.]